MGRCNEAQAAIEARMGQARRTEVQAARGADEACSEDSGAGNARTTYRPAPLACPCTCPDRCILAACSDASWLHAQMH